MWRSKRTTASFMEREPSPMVHGNASASHQDGDHFDEAGDSQAVHEQPQNVAWNENISFHDDDVLETIDSDGKVGTKKGQVQLSQVWVLESLKFIVKFNKFKQPIGKGGHLLVRFLGEVAKDGTLCPIGEISWHKVQKSYKLDIVRLTRSKFHMPNDLDLDQRILSHVNGKWKTYRHKLKGLYFDHKKTEQQVASNVPKNVNREQWVRLVSYWFSSTGKRLSTIGKRARAQKADCHTTGSKSFAQMKFEFEKTKNREPSILEVWKITHQRKDGSYIHDTNTKEFLAPIQETAEKMVDERIVEHPELPKEAIEDEVFNELMYDEEISNQKVVGYGHGVSRSQVFGLKADLRKCSSIDDFNDVRGKLVSIEKENEELKNAHVSMLKENEQLKNSHANLQCQLRRITSALARNGIVLGDPIGRDGNERNRQSEEVGAHASSARGIQDET